MTCPYFTFHLIIDHLKRKICRRPSWKRGIIRKKKSYKKGAEEEEEEEQEAEVEAAGPSDSCLTHDEDSSCDTPGPQPNGHHLHDPSTEEESSNEPPVVAEGRKDLKPKEEEASSAKGQLETPEKSAEQHRLCGAPQPSADEGSRAKQADFQPLMETFKSSDAQVEPKQKDGLSVSQVDCVNGTESMDSVDLLSLKRSDEADTRTPLSSAEGCDKPEQEEHKDKNVSKLTQEQHPLDDGAGSQTVEEDQGKEGTYIFLFILLDLNTAGQSVFMNRKHKSICSIRACSTALIVCI